MTDAEFRRRAHSLIASTAAEDDGRFGPHDVGEVEALIAAGAEDYPPRRGWAPIWRMGSKVGESPSSIYEEFGSWVKDCASQDAAEAEVIEHNRQREGRA